VIVYAGVQTIESNNGNSLLKLSNDEEKSESSENDYSIKKPEVFL